MVPFFLLLLLPLAFAAGSPNIVIVLTDDQVDRGNNSQHNLGCFRYGAILVLIIGLLLWCQNDEKLNFVSKDKVSLNASKQKIFPQDVFLDGMMPLQKTQRLIGDHGTTFEVDSKICKL